VAGHDRITLKFKTNDVVVGKNGRTYSCSARSPSGHGNAPRRDNSRKDGKFNKAVGKHGSGPAIRSAPEPAIASKGRWFVGGPANNRIQIFDTGGHYLHGSGSSSASQRPVYRQEGQLYVADSESTDNEGMANIPLEARYPNRSAKTGMVTALHSRSGQNNNGYCRRLTTAEGRGAVPKGVIMGPERGRRDVKNVTTGNKEFHED